ncbi:MAG: gfo/Idh/MocA family oxidoreductase [Bacteroidetes bacterium]|nr:MAG: gfo/Idh/MocA family oxidoreductase [Bacteroidota bacterium]
MFSFVETSNPFSMHPSNINRRKFITTSLKASAAGLALAGSFPAKSYARILGANDRLNIGVIGCGGMGSGHINALMGMKASDNIDILAVCDVYDKRRDQAAQLTGAPGFRHYQRLIDMKELDYLLIATPEHWHHRIAMDALDAGKHVYVEKPMTHTIKEALQLVEKVEQTGLKLQVGVQGMSDDSYLTANQYIQQGVLGKIMMAHIDYSRNGNLWQYEIDPDARPGVNLDWELWLGPAPKVPWDPKRYFQWRRYWDYSGGVATDLFIHRLTRILKAVGLQMPQYVTAAGGYYYFTGPDKAEVPDTFNMMLDYPGGPTVMLVSTQKNNTPIRHLIRGDKATLEFTRTGFEITPQKVAGENLISGTGEKLPVDEEGVLRHVKTGAEDITLHHRNLMAAIREGAPLNCDAKLGLYGMAACKMGVMSFRKRRYYMWDEQRQKPLKAKA